MSKWTIYNKNGVQKLQAVELEFHDAWMGEEFVTVNITSATPINLEIGDYLVYRGLTYTIYSLPTALKQARSGSHGDAFKYDGVKLSARSTELTEIRFLDIVLYDNGMHYTSLPTFSFYAETVDDLLDRIQANTDRNGETPWLVISYNYTRTVNRYPLNSPQRTAAIAVWKSVFGDTPSDNPTNAARDNEKKNVNISIDRQNVFDGLQHIKNSFGLNFITRERILIVGGEGISAEHLFKYGKGNGLYQIERNADTEQQIVTKLFAYGSDKNIPSLYYATIGASYFVNSLQPITTSINQRLVLVAFNADVDDEKYYTVPSSSSEEHRLITLKYGDNIVQGYFRGGRIFMVYNADIPSTIDYMEHDYAKAVAFANAVNGKSTVTITEGIDIYTWPADHVDFSSALLPNNMAVNCLMLPGFPTYSLYELCQYRIVNVEGGGKKTCYDIRKTPLSPWNTILEIEGEHPISFSTNRLIPFILSQNVLSLGTKEGDIHFTEENDDNGLKEVCPSVEGMTENDVFNNGSDARLDEIVACETITDDGRYRTDDPNYKFPNFHLTIPNLGFDLEKVAKDSGGDVTISLTDGYCGGRDFKVITITENNDHTWDLEVQRCPDDTLSLMFPYSDAAAHGQTPVANEPYQIRTGDHYVLTGINITETSYIWGASIHALIKAIKWLLNNDYTRFTYLPKVDEIYMARQNDLAAASQGTIKSLHDTLKAGMMMSFQDTDLNVDGNIFIDSLTIKENGNNGIPSYEVVLRNDKQVSTLQRVQNQINSLTSFVNGGGGGMTISQIKSLIATYGGEQFLSKLNDDRAQGFIRFIKGMQVGEQFVSGLLGEGGVFRKEVDGTTYIETDKLYVRMKAYFDNVEIKDYEHTSGNRIASKAGLKCTHVEYIDSNGEVTEVLEDAVKFRCYFRAKDGEDTIDNDFVVNDLAFCDKTTFEDGTISHHRYWRAVVGKNGTLSDDEEFGYIDLSKTDCESGSDVPLAGDDISQLGNKTNTERQGAIIEYVGGANAPSYQIYQGINSYSLSNKNYITIGYDSSTGRAKMDVFGDAYIGDRNGTTFVKYEQENSVTHAPKVTIKAEIDIQSTFGGESLQQRVEEYAPEYDDREIRAMIDGLQDQIDGAIDTWFYDYMPVAQDASGAPSGTVPLVYTTIGGQRVPCEPYYDWYTADQGGSIHETNTERLKHLGDIFYDNKTGYAFRFSNKGTDSIPVFAWVEITDSAVIKALHDAAQAQATADHKSTIFLNDPTAQTNKYPTDYKKGDSWVLPSGSGEINISNTATERKFKRGSILTTDVDMASTGYNPLDWSEKVRYTDDTYAHGFDFLTSNLARMNTTQIDGGLILSSLIGLRDSNQNIQSGINGIIEAAKKGNGIAAWYGGEQGDKEDQENYTGVTRWAKSLFRFDGSGYLADGNITWNASGAVTIKNITTLYAGQDTDILNELATFNEAFNFATSGSGGSQTVLSITPRVPFTTLEILDTSVSPNVGRPVATQKWVNDNYISIQFFETLFNALNASGNKINANTTTGIASIKAMFGFWTEQYISALGKNSAGGGGGGTDMATVWAAMRNNTTEPINLSHISDALEEGGYATQNWVTNNFTYTLQPATTTTLGGVIVGSTLSISNGVLNQKSGIVTADTYRSVTVDTYGRVTAGTNPTTLSGYGITDAKIDNGVITLGGNSITPITTLYTLSIYGGTTKVVDFKPNANASIYIKASGDISLTNDTTNKYITLSYSHPTNGANVTIEAANGKVLSAITVNNLGHVTSVSSKTLAASDIPSLSWNKITSNKPTTLSGYGITDAKIANGVITLGGNTITPVTSVAMTVPTGFSVSGSPISKTGTLAVTYASGYEGFTTALKNKIDLLYSLFTREGSGTQADPYVIKANYGLYTESFLSALGLNSGGSGGGTDMQTVWAALAANTSEQINASHLSDVLVSYSTKAQTVSSLQLSNGTLTITKANGAASTMAVNLDNVTDGTTRKLSNYVPKSGGTMTGNLVANGEDIYIGATNYDPHNFGYDAIFVKPTKIEFSYIDEEFEVSTTELSRVKSGTNAGRLQVGNGNIVAYLSDISDSDTKNTAGTTNKTDTKMFLVGATQQAANPQTYSNINVYIDTDNCLYSNGQKVLTSQSLANYMTTNTDQLALWGKKKWTTSADGALSSTGNVATQIGLEGVTFFAKELGVSGTKYGRLYTRVDGKLYVEHGTNGSSTDIVTKTVAYTDDIPTKVSDLTNDSGFTTQEWVQQQGYASASQFLLYLPLAGGTLSNAGASTPLTIKTGVTNGVSAYIAFADVNGNNLGYLGVSSGVAQFKTGDNTYTIYHSGNLVAATQSAIGLMSAADKTKLDGLSNYSLPLAANGTRGGVQIGYSETNSGTDSSRNYAVKLSSEKMYVNVPWVNTWTAWVGATASAAGTAGYMPAPTSAQRNKFLRGDGTWVSLNNYSLPAASASALGGIMLGYVATAGEKKYAVSLDSNNKAYVSVPWTDTDTWKPANTTQEGYVPKLKLASSDTIVSQTGDYVLTYNAVGETTPVWRKLPLTAFSDTTYESKAAVNGGSEVSLVTTGEKYSWSNPSLVIALDAGTSQIALTHGGKYKLTVGGSTLIFTMPSADDTNTWRGIYTGGTSRVGNLISSKAMNFAADTGLAVEYIAAGTSTGQSGSDDYFTIRMKGVQWVGATASANGTIGMMPAPTIAQRKQFLRGDGTWVSLNNYSLPLAADGTRGGIQIGYSESGSNYAVKLDSEKAYVTVPWTDTNTATLIVSNSSQKKIGTSESNNTIQFTGGTNKFTVSDGTKQFDVNITPSVTFPVTSVVGQTGDVTTAQIATALTNANYKLTDTWKAANTSQEGYVPKLQLAASSVINSQTGDYVLTYNAAGETTPSWRKLPLNAFNDTTYEIATGDANGQIKVTPSTGSAYNVSVKGLGSNAYTSTAYLPLGGGNMTGNIGYTGTKSTYTMITFIDNTDNTWGNGIAIGGGGLTIIGGGESASVIAAQHSSGGDENMCIGNDGSIEFYSNLQSGWNSRKTMTFSDDGNLYIGGSKVWTAANLTNNNQLVNGAGYITSASLSDYLQKSTGGTVAGALKVKGSDCAGYVQLNADLTGTVTFFGGTQGVDAITIGQNANGRLANGNNVYAYMSDITSAVGDYLPLTGGTLSNSVANILRLKRTSSSGGAFMDFLPVNQTTKFFRIGASASKTDFAFEYWNGSNSIVPLYISSTGVLTIAAAQGTAPLAITSTTRVANLNADLLDGYHASQFFKFGYSYAAGDSTKPYRLVAEVVINNNSSTLDDSISFFVSEYYVGPKYGILTIRSRTTQNANSLEFFTADWTVANGITPSDFIITNKKVTNGFQLRLYCKRTEWSSYSFVKLIEHSWGNYSDRWTLRDARGTNSYCYAEIPSDEAQTVSTLLAIDNTSARATSADYATSAGTAAGAGNLSGGAVGSIPYQTGVGTTAFLAAPTNNDYVLAFNTSTNTPYWKADANSNSWRNIFVGGGTQKVGTGTNTKGINFSGTDGVSVSYYAAGTSQGQSGNADYFTIGISLNTASSNVLGGIKVGYTTDATNRNYKVQLDGSNNAYVNVPWTNVDSTKVALTGDTMTGILTVPKIRINGTMSSSSITKGIYYYNGATDYLLIGQGSANIWIGANETVGTHHPGSTYISAGSGGLYVSKLVNNSRNNYMVIDAQNWSTYIGTSTNKVGYSEEADHATSADSVAWDNVTGKPSVMTTNTDQLSLDGSKKWVSKNTVLKSDGNVATQIDLNGITFFSKTITPSASKYSLLYADTSGKMYVEFGNTGSTSGVTTKTIAYTSDIPTLAGLMGSSAKGSGTQPIYWDGSAFVNTTYTLGKSVPSDAKFTDTTYTIATGDANGQIKVTPSSGSAYNVNVKGLGSAAYLNADAAASNSTVAKRTADGYLFATYFNQSSAAETPTTDSNWMFCNADGYLRKSTRADLEKNIYPYEAKLQWGGRNLTGTYGPIDAAMVPELGANRVAFMAASAVTVQYSRDAGATWTDYEASSADKINLLNGNGTFLRIGKNSTAGVNYTNYRLRIILTTGSANVYSELHKFVLLITTNGSAGSWCTIDARLQSNVESNTDTWMVLANQVSLSGWSGYNIINTDKFRTYGNNKTNQYGQVRFTFGNTGYSTSYEGLIVNKIYCYGGVGWKTPSNLATTGHLYSYNDEQNATFPANVKSTGFLKTGSDDTYVLTGGGGHALITGLVVGQAATSGYATNAGSASKLTNSRTLWGQSFDGSGNVSGNMTDVGSISASGNITVGGQSQSGNTGDITVGRYITLLGAYGAGFGENRMRLSSDNIEFKYFANDEDDIIATLSLVTSGINVGRLQVGNGNIIAYKSDIPSVSGYLPLSGGTISNANFSPLYIQRNHTTNAAAIGFKHYSSGTTVEAMGYIGMNAKDGALKRWNAASNVEYTILDSSNSSVSLSESTLSVKINGVTKSLTNTWRGISNSYSGTDQTISLSQYGANQLYNSLGSTINNLSYFSAIAWEENGKLKFSGHNVQDTIINFSHTHAFSEITGTVANNQLANSSITINGTIVNLGGSMSISTVDNTKLPLTGGTLTGGVTISTSGNRPFALQTSASYSTMRFKTASHDRTFGINGSGNLFVTNDGGWSSEYLIWHAGNASINTTTGTVTIGDNSLSIAGLASQTWVDSNYLAKSGGTMSGVLTLKANQYNAYTTGTGALNCNNSDIVGVNSILTSDLSNSWTESIGFKRTNGNYDTFRAADGTFYFGVNNGTNEYTAVHSGNIASQSVNYASSAGSATSATTAGSATTIRRLFCKSSEDATASGYYKIATITHSNWAYCSFTILTCNSYSGNMFNTIFDCRCADNSTTLRDFAFNIIGGTDISSKLSYLVTKNGDNITKIEVFMLCSRYEHPEFFLIAQHSSSIMALNTTDWGSTPDKATGTTMTGNAVNTIVSSALTSKSIGSSTQPVYFDANGKPVVCTSYANASVASAGKLTTARTIWGQSFDGSDNVSGNMTGVGTISASGDLTITKTSGKTVANLVNSIGNDDIKYQVTGKSYTMWFGIGSGNVNRGIYNQTESAWMLYFNASNTILQYGNVGIGTTTPAYKLDVNGTANVTGVLTTHKILNLGTASSNPIQTRGIIGSASDGSAADDLFVQHTTNKNVILVCGGGNVGINTTTPAYKLDVAGTINATGTITQNGVAVLTKDGGSLSQNEGLSFVDDGTTTNDNYLISVNYAGLVFGYNDNVHGRTKTYTITSSLDGLTINGDLILTEGNIGLTLTPNATGFSISGGTTSKTLTVSNSYTLGAACAKGVTDNTSNTDVTNSDTNLITGRTLYYQLAKKGYITASVGTLTSLSSLQFTSSLVISDRTRQRDVMTFSGTNDSVSILASEFQIADRNGESVLHFNVNADDCLMTDKDIEAGGSIYAGGGLSSPSIYEDITNERVGINTTSPTCDFEVYGSAKVSRLGINVAPNINYRLSVSGNINLEYTSNSKIYFNSPASGVEILYLTTKSGVTCNNVVTATGFNNNSDARKKNIVDDYALVSVDTIANAPAVRFRWKDSEDTKLHCGTIAQYWDVVMPECTVHDAEGYISMQYDVIALLAAISVAKKVVDHEQRITELEKENERLRTELEQIKLNIA